MYLRVRAIFLDSDKTKKKKNGKKKILPLKSNFYVKEERGATQTFAQLFDA